jgi:hypothetical protein
MSALAVPLREPRPSLGRLTHVELRKTGDTRAGRWLLGIIAFGIVAVTVVFGLVADADERTFVEFFRLVQAPTAILLPVLAILLVTSEWSQRTALTTFTLVPDRWRVVAAKLSALGVIAVVTLLISVVVAAIGNLAFGGDGSWAFGADDLGESFVMQAVGLLGGFAFGLVLQSSAPAIVLYYVLPTIWSILTEVATGIQDVVRWLDIGQTTIPLSEGMVSGTEWARIGTSVAVWVLIPLIAGLVRLPRSEVK